MWGASNMSCDLDTAKWLQIMTDFESRNIQLLVKNLSNFVVLEKPTQSIIITLGFDG